MTSVMPESAPSLETTEIISIDTIKKAFIQQHQRPAANQVQEEVFASTERVEAVKRVIAPLEQAHKTSVEVVAQAIDDVPLQGCVQIQQSKAVLVAAGIQNDQQAHNQFYLAVVGYLAVPSYLGKKSHKILDQIFASFSEEQIAAIVNIQAKGENQKETDIAAHYLAHLASMNLTPSFYERRDSFQRGLVRLFYPRLKWSNLDLQYLILRAKKRWVRKNK